MSRNSAVTSATFRTAKPAPDWGRRGTQPKGKLTGKPKPNGQVVATQPQKSN